MIRTANTRLVGTKAAAAKATKNLWGVVRKRDRGGPTNKEENEDIESSSFKGTSKQARRESNQRDGFCWGSVSTNLLLASVFVWFLLIGREQFKSAESTQAQEIKVQERIQVKASNDKQGTTFADSAKKKVKVEANAGPTGQRKQSVQRISLAEERKRIAAKAEQHKQKSEQKKSERPARPEKNPAARAAPLTQRKKKKDVKDDDENCERPDWQLASFPNCNEIHEIDLTDTYRRSSKENKVGWVADGFWREVIVVDPRIDVIVMKMMKVEHEVDKRNFDRHRRDALVMERTTSSPYVVDGYGFCGNTVLTEYLDAPLDDFLYDGRGVGMVDATRDTAEGRVRLALDVARGVAALHAVHGGPIVHADIQARQFLLTATGRTKINDFNRCRFMATNKQTGKTCPFRIPTAPGKMRAPEEYDLADLDEQLDVYSTANVLYAILTGEPAWDEDSSSDEVQRKIRKGLQPLIPEKYQISGSADEVLADLIVRAYAVNPRERITAPKLVAELEQLLNWVKKESY
jgi:hypothetical protein